MPAQPSTTISPRLSIGAALACYISACLHILFIGITLKGLELSERVVASVLVAVGVKPLDRSDLGTLTAGVEGCDMTRQEGNYEYLYGVDEHIRLEEQIGEDELDDKEDEDEVVQPENRLHLCKRTTGTEKQVSRWGAVPDSEEHGKKKMEYTDSHDSPCDDQMDTSLSDNFDDISSVDYGAPILLRPFALNCDLGCTVTPAQSGDSIASNDPFLPPGLGPLALSLKSHRTFRTCIQPRSAAASSSRSRMSFAALFNNDALAGDCIEDQIKASPTELMKARPRATRLRRETREVGPTVKANVCVPTDVGLIPNANSTVHMDANVIYDPKATITKTKTNTPIQIYRALSTLSFWTPAPKIAVTIAPPMKRRRGGRRRDKERNKERENESASHDVFGERMLLLPMGED